MQTSQGDDGCPAFNATVNFDPAQLNWVFHWGVIVDGPGGRDQWAIPTEVADATSANRIRSFVLSAPDPQSPQIVQQERYFLTHCRRLGAQKLANGRAPSVRFSVWSPDAKAVDVMFGTWTSGYIDDSGQGRDPALPIVPLHNVGQSIWESDPSVTPVLSDFASLNHIPYMFRITQQDGSYVYRTDLYSRCQIGRGTEDPEGAAFYHTIDQLNGGVSCSVLVDPDTVTGPFKEPEWPGDRNLFVPETDFWRDEFDAAHPIPTRLADLVIYELHVASLGLGQRAPDQPGTFEDAMSLVENYLVPLGVNAVELLPVAEFGGHNEWGYGDTHLFALEFRSGGRDQLKHVVRACHQRGIAVILDVVYNHFFRDATRAEWEYDSVQPEQNFHYWYEGLSSYYPSPDGGYLDNGSTGYSPRFWEENVRKLFISSAAALVDEFHIDGFRVDLTQAIHRDNVLHANGQSIAAANMFGQKFLREWSRTLKMIRPSVILIAEDHTGWEMVTRVPDEGGLGFDAAWYVDFYHNLVGTLGDSWASLVAQAGTGTDGSLHMDAFAGALAWSGNRKVVYHISHDEAGNSSGSHRTLVQAVDGKSNLGAARSWAEARSRFAFGMSILSAGTPMFLFGEEVGAINDYTWNDYLGSREDLWADRTGAGARLYKFYQDAISMRLSHSAARSTNLEILHVHNDNRVVAFRRWDQSGELAVFASLNNQSFSSGYRVEHSSLTNSNWREIFNSDSGNYGGGNIGNFGKTISSSGSAVEVVLPANGVVVFQRV